MSREEVHIRDRLFMLAESSTTHRPFNVKRKGTSRQNSKNGPKLSVQDFVRMDPGYTPDIEHLVFPGRKRNPQQVAPSNLSTTGKTRSRLAEMFALSRHLQQRSVDRDTKSRNNLINRSVDSMLETPRVVTVPRTAESSKRWVVEEPVRQSTTKLSPAKEPDMAAARGPNVSVLHLRSSTDPWETNPTTVFTTSASGSRSYSTRSTCAPTLSKHQSLGGTSCSQLQSYKYNINNQSFHSGGDVNSTEIFLNSSCSRELSPVRWCDREVDGVYLGRSGWVQVQQRSLDENRRSGYASSESLQPSKRIGIKLADYHCTSEPGKFSDLSRTLEPQRPIYLDLRARDFERISKTPSPQSMPESFSPPSITPIISPPPAFQDRNNKGIKMRTFFGKPPFLPRSNAIVDSDGSPPSSPKPTRNSSLNRKQKVTSSPISEQIQRGHYKIPQTKSLEDTTATRRTQFLQRYGDSSSSSSSSMGFRSLDSYVPRIGMPRLSENTDSSVDVYEDADDEDNNSSSVISSIKINTPVEVRPKEKISPSNRPARLIHRPQIRKSPVSSDTNKQSNCNSPTSSSSSNEFLARNVAGVAQQTRRSAPVRQYQIPEDSASRVRRSRSLQLPDRKAPVNFRDQNRVSPQHPDLHRVIVKVGNTKRHGQSKPHDELDENMLREAEVVTGFLYGNRSRAAAQALLIHRYNNRREEKLKESINKSVPNNGYNVYIVDNSKKERPNKVFQRGSTAPNLCISKKSYSNAQSESKNPCNSDTCDFWPHCAHRETLHNQAQSMMRLSQSYPTHQRSADKTSPETNKPVLDCPPQKRLSRADTDVRSIAVHSGRRPASTVFIGTGEVGTKHDKRSSPNKSVSVERKGLSDRVFDIASNSSSSSDVYVTTSERTVSKSPKNAKSSSASTPLEETPVNDEAMHEVILTRPGSAPGEKNKSSFVDSQQRSMSLPKSFLSASYQPESQYPWKKKGTETLKVSPGLNKRVLVAAAKAQTAPVTPLHEGNRRRSPVGSASRRAKATSTPQLLDPSTDVAATTTENRKWNEKGNVEAQMRLNSKEFTSLRNPSGSTTESVLQKFRKTFSLRFQKKGSKESCSTDLGEPLTEIQVEASEQDSPLHIISSRISPTNNQVEPKEDHSEQKYKFGSLIWRSSKERKKLNKAARNAKCNSGDSGIQIEMAPSCGGTAGDSSESHDTDPPGDDLDSPPAVRRRGQNPSKGSRPHSDLLNQILIDKFKAELRSRAHKHQHVRRAHSDLGGQRILTWEPRSSYRRLMSSPAPLKPRPQSPKRKPPDTPEGVQLREPHRRGQLRRSLSQPLDIDKLSPLMRVKASVFRSGGANVLSEDEQDARGGTSDDDMMSDSESSITSLNERKKSLELAMDEDVIILAEAVFDHVAIEFEELAFRAGDVIEVQTTANRDWWWGSCNGKSGWFPAAFVRLRVSQEDTVEDCLAAMASGRSVQSQIRRRTSISLLSNDQVRTSVVRELVHTERDFVKVLQDVAEGYITECRKRKDMFTKEQIETIFINLEEILKFQSNFLRDLETSIDWDAPHKSCVGDCFIKHKDGFTMYSDYCNSHPIATATLQELYQFNNYSKFFEACRLMRGLIEIPLDGYLLTPVQRICKYPLQLGELLKYTKADHPDYENIKEALETMRRVAVLINERKRRMESLEKLAAWQQRVEGWEDDDLIEESSQLIHQGEVVRVTTGMWTSNIILFLFDHQLVYCKKDILKRNTYVYKGRVHLDTTEVIDVPDGKDIHIGVTVRHAIKLYSVIRDKWLLFCCRSFSDKQRWLQAFVEERKLVAQDKSNGLEFPPAAKQLARVAARCQRRPPRKPGGSKNYKTDSAYMSMLQLNTQSSNSLGRKVGNWFTFGASKKMRHQHRDVS